MGTNGNKGILIIITLVIVLIGVITAGTFKEKRELLEIKAKAEEIEQARLDEISEKRKSNKWFETKAVFIGDSITEGEDPLNNYAPMFGNRYTDLLEKEFQFSEVVNYGIGGSRITTQENGNGMIDRYDRMVDADLIGVFGGTNDFGNSVKMGKVNDGDISHFKYAFSELLKGLKAKYPDKTIFVITPFHRNDQHPDATANEAGYTLEDYVNAEIEISESLGIPVLNLYDKFGIDPNNQSDKEKYIPDGLHPNIDGMAILADEISKFIKTL